MTFYEINSLFAPIMSDADSSSRKVLLLFKHKKVNVLSIHNEWAYCNYRNKKGYIKLSNLKESSPVYVNLIIKYVDESTLEDIAEPSQYTELDFGSYTYYPILVSGYSPIRDFPVTASITRDNPIQVITFKYKKTLGSVTINYIDTNTLESLAESSVYKNVQLGSHTYYPIQIDGYTSDEAAKKTVVLNEDNLDEIITFKYNLNKSTSEEIYTNPTFF